MLASVFTHAIIASSCPDLFRPEIRAVLLQVELDQQVADLVDGERLRVARRQEAQNSMVQSRKHSAAKSHPVSRPIFSIASIF